MQKEREMLSGQVSMAAFSEREVSVGLKGLLQKASREVPSSMRYDSTVCCSAGVGADIR